MTAILLALAASACWGVADFTAGLKSRSLSLLSVMVVLQIAGFAVIGPVVAIRWDGPPNALFALYAGLAGISGFVGVAAFYRGLAIGTMGVVAPITATSPLIPVVGGLVRGERPSSLQYGGMVLALGGIILASRDPAAERPGRFAVGAGLGVLSSVCFGLALLGLNEASKSDPYWGTLVFRLTTTALVLVAILAVRPSFAGTRGALPLLAAVGALEAIGIILYSVASTRGLLSVVAVLSSLYPVLIVVLARIVVKERLTRVQLTGASAALAGAALLSAG